MPACRPCCWWWPTCARVRPTRIWPAVSRSEPRRSTAIRARPLTCSPRWRPRWPRRSRSLGGKAYVVLDGTLLRIDRVGMTGGRDRPYYSGKHKCHGVNVQVIADPAGRLVWASPTLPGARHDMGNVPVGIQVPDTGVSHRFLLTLSRAEEVTRRVGRFRSRQARGEAQPRAAGTTFPRRARGRRAGMRSGSGVRQAADAIGEIIWPAYRRTRGSRRSIGTSRRAEEPELHVETRAMLSPSRVASAVRSVAAPGPLRRRGRRRPW
jgi:hypothetical protein